jgi:transposase
MTQQRRHFTPEQKVALLQQHLVEKVPISEGCLKYGIAVNLFYLWQKTFFDNGTVAFTANDKRRKTAADPKTEKSPNGRHTCNANTKFSPNSWRSMSS